VDTFGSANVISSVNRLTVYDHAHEASQFGDMTSSIRFSQWLNVVVNPRSKTYKTTRVFSESKILRHDDHTMYKLWSLSWYGGE
jgi:hypothetical protein